MMIDGKNKKELIYELALDTVNSWEEYAELLDDDTKDAYTEIMKKIVKMKLEKNENKKELPDCYGDFSDNRNKCTKCEDIEECEEETNEVPECTGEKSPVEGRKCKECTWEDECIEERAQNCHGEYDGREDICRKCADSASCKAQRDFNINNDDLIMTVIKVFKTLMKERFIVRSEYMGKAEHLHDKMRGLCGTYKHFYVAMRKQDKIDCKVSGGEKIKVYYGSKKCDVVVKGGSGYDGKAARMVMELLEGEGLQVAIDAGNKYLVVRKK